MAGLFPSIANSQNVDVNGDPLANAVLSVYSGGTLALASVFQDINLITPAPNPMNADATGRLPLFYVADGVYRVRLTDQFGATIYDYPQVASIGASTSGGGGTTVDPTTIFTTGDVLWLDTQGTRAGWVRDNGRTIGSATSGASERANTDCQALFLFGWAAGWSVVGGKGATAAADWAANKQITLPDKRGYAPVGLDGMGNSRANKLADSHVTIAGPSGGVTADTAGAQGGETDHTNTTNEMPSHTHPLTNASEILVTDGTPVAPASGGTLLRAVEAGVTIGNTGGGASHNNMQPFALGTFFRKL